MDRRSEAESARGGNNEYYEMSPLGFLGDSYFTQNPYYSHNPNENAQGRLGLETPPNYTGPARAPAPQIVEPTGYSPYYQQNPMDLEVLSAESYQRDYAQVGSTQRGREHAPLFGITASNSRRPNTPSPTAGTRTRRSRKESLKGTSADEANSARQRGRPRLDTKDQTAAERRRTQIRLAQRAYRQRKETTISGLNSRVTSLEKTIDDMHKTFRDFTDTAIALGIQNGAPALAGHLKTTAERLSELAKNSTEDSDVEEDENDPRKSVQPMAVEHRSRRQGRELGPEPASMLGYQTTLGEEEEEEEEEEDAGEIAAPPVRSDLDNHLPLSDWAGTENMQQLRSEGSKSPTWSQNISRPMRQDWVNVLDNNIEHFLRSKGLYLDDQYSTAFGPIDPSLGSKETSLPAVSSPYHSPSLNSSGGPHTPRSIDAPWPNESHTNGNHIFWNETANVCKASDVDINDPFDEQSILL